MIRRSTRRRSSSNCFSPGPRRPDPLLLPREVRPHPLQPRHGVFQLGQFDRQPGLVRLGPPGENVEDQLRAVEDLYARDPLEVADLSRAEVVVEDDHVGVAGRRQRGQLFDLAFAEVGRGVGGLAALNQLPDDAGAGRVGQPFKLLQRRIVVAAVAGQEHADEHRGLAVGRSGSVNVNYFRHSFDSKTSQGLGIGD